MASYLAYSGSIHGNAKSPGGIACGAKNSGVEYAKTKAKIEPIHWREVQLA
jgi:hypothetical protein